MNEPLRVIRQHDPFEWVFMGGKVGEGVVGRSRNRHRPLPTTVLKPDDNVFLQHIIILECLAARLEQMDAPDGGTLKDEVTERAVVRPIAEAARDDRHDLPALRGQRHKGRVQIHRLDADTAQNQPVRRIAVDLLIGWIEDCVCIAFQWSREEIAGKRFSSYLNKVLASKRAVFCAQPLIAIVWSPFLRPNNVSRLHGSKAISKVTHRIIVGAGLVHLVSFSLSYTQCKFGSWKTRLGP